MSHWRDAPELCTVKTLNPGSRIMFPGLTVTKTPAVTSIASMRSKSQECSKARRGGQATGMNLPGSVGFKPRDWQVSP